VWLADGLYWRAQKEKKPMCWSEQQVEMWLCWMALLVVMVAMVAMVVW